MSESGTRGTEGTEHGTESAKEAKHLRNVHHGRTGAAWTGVATAGAGFVLAAYAMVSGPNWTLLWVAIGIVALALVATVVMQKLGYGAR